jgi:hypothetical protein
VSGGTRSRYGQSSETSQQGATDGPATACGLSLLGFAGGLNLLYLRVPGMRHEGSVKPTEMGVPIAKDFWMTAIGATLVLDSVFRRAASLGRQPGAGCS